MKAIRALFACALLAPTLLACSAGEDVVLTPSSNSSTTISALSCRVLPDEEICNRNFDLPEGDRARVVAFMQVAALFAGEARSLFDRTFAACDAIAAEIDVHGVGLPESSSLQRKKSVCAAVGKAYAALRSSLIVTQGTSRCTKAALPSCVMGSAIDLEPYERCSQAPITVTVSSDATGDLARAKVVAASLQRHLPELGGLKTGLEAMARLSSAITGGLPVDTSNDQQTTACIMGAGALVRTSVDEVQAASEATRLVLSAP